jgi:hypothetical protein
MVPSAFTHPGGAKLPLYGKSHTKSEPQHERQSAQNLLSAGGLERHADSDNGVMYTLEVAFISGDGVGSSFKLHVQGFVNITITVRSPGFQISPGQTYLSVTKLG